MRVLDLFSGIGGFSLGLERSGMETVAFCEIEKYPQKVLKKHWPEVPIYDDIRKLTRERLTQDGIGTIDLVCGGFPCQPFSQAGKQKGFDDDRDLWPEMFRVIQEVRPRWVIGENVTGFVNMGLDRTLTGLEGAGYRTEQVVIPACAIGAPHRRDRIWIVAHSRLLGQTEHEKQTAGFEQHGEDVPDSISKRRRGRNPKREYAKDVRESSPGERFRHWDIEPPVGRVANGIPKRVDRLKGLGNAVVPQIPEIIGRAIMEIESENKNIKP